MCDSSVHTAWGQAVRAHTVRSTPGHNDSSTGRVGSRVSLSFPVPCVTVPLSLTGTKTHVHVCEGTRPHGHRGEARGSGQGSLHGDTNGPRASVARPHSDTSLGPAPNFPAASTSYPAQQPSHGAQRGRSAAEGAPCGRTLLPGQSWAFRLLSEPCLCLNRPSALTPSPGRGVPSPARRRCPLS